MGKLEDKYSPFYAIILKKNVIKIQHGSPNKVPNSIPPSFDDSVIQFYI
jgi:hypothetical protein